MARLVVGNQVFHEVDLGCFHEHEVEAALKARAHLLYPGFQFVAFTATVEDGHNARQPDFLLIEQEYRSWWVGEVEMINHSLYDHVLPQVQVFRDGVYEGRHAAAAASKSTWVDESRLGLLIASERPGVLVIANRFDAQWQTTLRAEGVELGVFEMFRREDLTEFIFRANGFAPEAPGERLTLLEVDRSIERLVRLGTPSALPASATKIQIDVNGAMTDWTISVHGDKGWLRAEGGHRLERDAKYELIRGLDGRLRMEKAERRYL